MGPQSFSRHDPWAQSQEQTPLSKGGCGQTFYFFKDDVLKIVPGYFEEIEYNFDH